MVLLNSKLLKDYLRSSGMRPVSISEPGKRSIPYLLFGLSAGHKVHIDQEQADSSVTVEIADLIGAGLPRGWTDALLSPRKVRRPYRHGSVGRADRGGRTSFRSPSRAGKFCRKKNTNGWNFWRLEPNGRRRLKDVRNEYLRVVSPEKAEEEDADPGETD